MVKEFRQNASSQQRRISQCNVMLKQSRRLVVIEDWIIPFAASVLELPGGWGIPPPTAVVDLHVIQGVEVSALSAPRCRLPLFFSTTIVLHTLQQRLNAFHRVGLTPKIVHSRGGSRSHLIHGSMGPCDSPPPLPSNGISINSAVFLQPSHVPNTQTYRPRHVWQLYSTRLLLCNAA